MCQADNDPVSIHEFLLISDQHTNQLINTAFLGKYTCVNSFAAARSFLSVQAKKSVPLFIIVSQKLNHDELFDFKDWLKRASKNFIPVFYNETFLLDREKEGLRKMNLVDDVVNLEKVWDKLYAKAFFLKKMNEQASPLHLKRSKGEFKPCLNCRLKRLGDIGIASIAILLTSPLFLIIAILIKLDSRGNVFYCATRAGRGFKVFRFYKFRTMVKDADKQVDELAGLNIYKNSDDSPAFFKVENDPRVTKLGSFLRNTSLDELPQLFNVLKGDMSIVGNRPLPLKEAAALTTNEWAERFMAPAGITGLWQVSKRGSEDMSTAERMALDIEYARSHSFRDDLRIILKTPGALIQKTNV